MTPAFAADRTLGKLVKWLRLMGFDAIELSDAGGDVSESCGRLILTRTGELWRRVSDRGAIWIESDDPQLQIRQVISQLKIEHAALRPFTRCLGCNARLVPIPRSEVLGMVPDYIWETQRRFSQCPGCRRIFWPGSHIRRSRARLDELFGD